MTLKTYPAQISPAKTRSELCEQIECMDWLAWHYPDRYGLIFHCPNEVKASAQYMATRAKSGVKSGVPDIIDAYSRTTGFFELKRVPYRDEKGKVHKNYPSKEQKEFLNTASERGHFAAVCYGVEAFKAAYADFLLIADK